MKRMNRQDLLRETEMILLGKVIGDHHCHSFDEKIEILQSTYQKAVKKRALTFFHCKHPQAIRHTLYEVFISDTGVRLSTPSYHLPLAGLTKAELQQIYRTMKKECQP